MKQKLLLLESENKELKVVKGYETNHLSQIQKINQEFQYQWDLSRKSVDHFVEVYDLKMLPQKGVRLHQLIIEMEYCEKQDLMKDLIQKKEKSQSYELKEIQEIITQTINGAALMQQNQISHRDIKLDNIFVTKNGKAKFGDFGEAIKIFNADQVVQMQVVGTE